MILRLNKSEFHYHKIRILLDDVAIDKMIVSNKVSSNEKKL